MYKKSFKSCIFYDISVKSSNFLNKNCVHFKIVRLKKKKIIAGIGTKFHQSFIILTYLTSQYNHL